MRTRKRSRNRSLLMRRPAPLEHHEGGAPRRLFDDASGATAVEFALVAPVMIVMIFGILEFGRAAWTMNALNFAAESAARCAAVDQNNCGTTAQIQNHAAGFAAGLALPPSTFTVSTEACGRQVVATFAFTSVAPIVASIPITLSARACYPTPS